MVFVICVSRSLGTAIEYSLSKTWGAIILITPLGTKGRGWDDGFGKWKKGGGAKDDLFGLFFFFAVFFGFVLGLGSPDSTRSRLHSWSLVFVFLRCFELTPKDRRTYTLRLAWSLLGCFLLLQDFLQGVCSATAYEKLADPDLTRSCFWLEISQVSTIFH